MLLKTESILNTSYSLSSFFVYQKISDNTIFINIQYQHEPARLHRKDVFLLQAW